MFNYLEEYEQQAQKILDRYTKEVPEQQRVHVRRSVLASEDFSVHVGQFRESLENVVAKLKFDQRIFHVHIVGKFLNFRILSLELCNRILRSILSEGSRYPIVTAHKETIIVEHTSANPTGRLHVGRARNTIIGDTIYRLYKRLGYQNTKAEYYINDLGKQAIICGEGDPENVTSASEFSKRYTKLVTLYKNDQTFQTLVDQKLQRLESFDEDLLQFYQNIFWKLIQKLILPDTSMFRAHFDIFTSEAQCQYQNHQNQVQCLLSAPENQKFLEFPEQKLCIMKHRHNGRKIVLRKSDGSSVYLSRDMVYNILRSKRCQKAIVILGEDTRDHNEMLRESLKILGFPQSNIPLYYNFVVLKEGKMSTRKQNVVTLHDLFQRVREIIASDSKNNHLTEDQITSLTVSIIRFAVLSKKSTRTVVFSFDSIFDRNSPESSIYPFYTFSRCLSIIEKSSVPSHDDIVFSEEILTPDITILIKHLGKLSALLQETQETLEYHHLATYLVHLCTLFNRVYNDTRIIGSNNEQELIGILRATKQTMLVLEEILGIEFLSRI